MIYILKACYFLYFNTIKWECYKSALELYKINRGVFLKFTLLKTRVYPFIKKYNININSMKNLIITAAVFLTFGFAASAQTTPTIPQRTDTIPQQKGKSNPDIYKTDTTHNGTRRSKTDKYENMKKYDKTKKNSGTENNPNPSTPGKKSDQPNGSVPKNP